MERLVYAKWQEIFKRFRELKKVGKHCSTEFVWHLDCWREMIIFELLLITFFDQANTVKRGDNKIYGNMEIDSI